jgi:hypothetical protein
MAIEQIPIGKFGFVKRQVIDWIVDHKGGVCLGVAAVIACLFSISHFVNRLGGNHQGDFVAASVVHDKWEGNKEMLVKLEKLIKKHPELHAKYDASIAQRLLSSSEGGLANSYAAATLKRIGQSSSYYTQFASGSLLISEGKLDTALQQARQLKVAMEQDRAFWERQTTTARHGSLLYAYNLLRIAMLEKAAGTPQGELAAWNELKSRAGWHDGKQESHTFMDDPEAYQLLRDNMKKQDLSLLDFINHRQKQLISDATVASTEN